MPSELPGWIYAAARPVRWLVPTRTMEQIDGNFHPEQAGRVIPGARRVSRKRLQAGVGLEAGHGARKVRLHARRLAATALRGRARNPRHPDRPRRALRLATRAGSRPAHSPARRDRRLHNAGAGRPARTVGRGARQHPPDLHRGEHPPAPGAFGVRAARHRLPGYGLSAQVGSCGHAVDAQGPLPHHAGLHEQSRQPGPGHDDPDLHRAGQPGLQLRSRHGAQIPHLAGAPAGGHRPVRQFPLHRWPAQRLSELPIPRLGGHRPGPHRHAALRVRRLHGFRALHRLHAGRADVLRLPGR